MNNQDTFLPLSTDEDAEHQQGFSVPNYRPINPGSNGTFAGSLSVDATGDNALNNSAGHNVLCCNCCCDFRRAVLVVNGISMGLKLLIMVGVAVGVSYVGNNLDNIESEIQDDDAREEMDAFVKTGLMALHEEFFEAFEIISIGLHACGIYGALKFKRWGVITAGIAYAIQMANGIFLKDIADILLSILFLYPHYYMYKLMKAGVMTDSNYHKIASCCGDRKM